MSYCRWSSDNFSSDVYVYENCGGGCTTHVAGNRLVFPPIPELPVPPLFGAKYDHAEKRVVYPSSWRKILSRLCTRAWSRWHDLHVWSVGKIPRRPIGLEFDGQTLWDATAGSCASRLVHLRAMGYRVPQRAIDALKAEHRDRHQLAFDEAMKEVNRAD